MSARRHRFGLALLLMIGTGAVLAVGALVFAQDRSHVDHAQHVHGDDEVVPTHPGQEAFGTIQEIVRILEADPATDWSKVSIGTLREHLIDMDEVTMRARTSERPLDNGIEITVTGEGRTLGAIKRMVPAHARQLAALGWSASTQDLPNGVKLVVTASDPRQVVEAQGARVHGHNGPGRTPPAPSPHDGERRVHPLEARHAASAPHAAPREHAAMRPLCDVEPSRWRLRSQLAVADPRAFSRRGARFTSRRVTLDSDQCARGLGGSLSVPTSLVVERCHKGLFSCGRTSVSACFRSV